MRKVTYPRCGRVQELNLRDYHMKPGGICVTSGGILYGNFDHFVIGDRGRRSIKRLNEIYAASGQVGFQVTQRVDAVLLDKKAIKCLQVQ